MFELISSLFLVVWEIVCCKFLLESFIRKRKYTHKICILAIHLGLVCIYYMSAWLLYEYLWLKQIAIVTVMSVAMYLLFESHYLKIMVLTMLYQGLVLIADYSTLLVLGKCFPSFSQLLSDNTGISVLVSIICKVVLLFVVLILKRNIRYQSGDMLTDLEWLQLLFIPIITIVSLTAIMVKFNVLQSMNQNYVLMYVALGMAGMNIMVFYLINDILEREMIIRNERLLRERAKNETDMYYSISENLDKQRKRTHEFKNQIAYIFSLANSNNYQELKEYIMKLDDELKLSMDMVDTNNVIVNAVLNTKYREAINKKIVFVLKINDLSNMMLSDMDIVVILSNLLDNAIEACADCENKVIKCKFVLEDDQIIISVKNSFSKKPRKNSEKFISGKEKPEEHGIGIENVIEVIQRYDGRYAIDYDDDMFSFSILINNIKK